MEVHISFIYSLPPRKDLELGGFNVMLRSSMDFACEPQI